MTARAPLRRMVTFGLGDAWYATDVAHVERVLRHEGVHPIPNMPSWMEGIIEYQRRVVPVINLRRRFHVNGEFAGAAARLLLFTLGEDLVAAVVDRVVDVRAVAEGEIAAPPRLVQGIAGEFLQGMMWRGESMVLVLDVPRLFTPDDRVVIDECLALPDGRDRAVLVAPAGSASDD